MAASCYGGVVCLCVAGRGWQPAVTVVWSVFVLLVGDGSQLLRWCGLSVLLVGDGSQMLRWCGLSLCSW